MGTQNTDIWIKKIYFIDHISMCILRNSYLNTTVSSIAPKH